MCAFKCPKFKCPKSLWLVVRTIDIIRTSYVRVQMPTVQMPKDALFGGADVHAATVPCSTA